MSEKPMTVAEMARMGGIARAKAHSKAEIRAWGKQGGRPPRLTSAARQRILEHLANGWSHARIAAKFGVSLRTIGRLVARERQGK